MDGMNWFVYCSNNPVSYIDPSGNIIIPNPNLGIKIAKDAYNQFVAIAKFARDSTYWAQKEAQRDFWRLGANVFLRNMKGYTTSAWMLEHSLQDNPSNEWRGDDSNIANLIKNDSSFNIALSNVYSANSSKNSFYEVQYVTFSSGDLYYSIHASTIYFSGTKQFDGSWVISCRLEDTYDFTEIQSAMGEGMGAAMGTSLGTIANDIAVMSQKTGAIVPYNITVEFTVTLSSL